MSGGLCAFISFSECVHVCIYECVCVYLRVSGCTWRDLRGEEVRGEM